LLAFGQPDLAHASFADTFDQSISAGHRRLETGVRKGCARQHFNTAIEQIVAVAHGRRLDGGDQPFNLAAQVLVACASLIKLERTLRVGSIEQVVDQRLRSTVAFRTRINHWLPAKTGTDAHRGIIRMALRNPSRKSTEAGVE